MYATNGTAKFLNENGFDVESLDWPDAADGGRLTTTFIKEGKVDLVKYSKNFRQKS